MRCFIAINIDDTLKKEIDESVVTLKKGGWDVKWVPSENLHVTLKFLGNTPEDSVQRIKESLSLITPYLEPFTLKLSGVGLFPDKRRPRVIWIDLLDSFRLKILKEKIEESLLSIGFEREDRPFSPHLTIGRIRSPKGNDSLFNAIETLKDKDFGNIGVDKISLMKSELKPTGAQYTTITEFYLKRRINDQ